MKHAVLCIFVCFTLSSPALAVLRPRYPVKPAPPYRGQVMIIGDNSFEYSPSHASKYSDDTAQSFRQADDQACLNL
jgi:hypothetical protein